jgi:hypothetical protein
MGLQEDRGYTETDEWLNTVLEMVWRRGIGVGVGDRVRAGRNAVSAGIRERMTVERCLDPILIGVQLRSVLD